MYDGCLRTTGQIFSIPEIPILTPIRKSVRLDNSDCFPTAKHKGTTTGSDELTFDEKGE